MSATATASRFDQAQKRDVETWCYRNQQLVYKLPAQFGLSSMIVRKVLAGQHETISQQLERQLAKLGCPHFQQYKPIPEGA